MTPDLYRALRARLVHPHSIPRFEGRNSRHHHDVSLWRLWAAASLARLRDPRRFSDVQTFVQFAGFPRSGHSLIGSILDAHPDARVSHELDAMGLLVQGFPIQLIFALIDAKSAEFTRHGRHWNGHCYMVQDGHHDTATKPRVMGDKKGDVAVRRIAQNSRLLTRLNRDRRIAKKWILVLRNPLDNIATMSLRKGRAYDQLKTHTSSAAEFHQALEAQQAEGTIAAEPLASEIDAYQALCETVVRIKQATAADNWFELDHETFSANPDPEIEAMLSFLGLEVDKDYVRNCSAVVKKSPNRSRDLLHWPDDKLARVRALSRDYSFLNRYEDDDAV